MVLKSYAKINLTLSVNNKLKNGLLFKSNKNSEILLNLEPKLDQSLYVKDYSDP